MNTKSIYLAVVMVLSIAVFVLALIAFVVLKRSPNVEVTNQPSETQQTTPRELPPIAPSPTVEKIIEAPEATETTPQP